jgi:hypothetical protein
MIMYKVTKGGIFEKEVHRITSDSVYYSFKELGSNEVRSRRELRVTSRHLWVKNKDEASRLYEKLIG